MVFFGIYMHNSTCFFFDYSFFIKLKLYFERERDLFYCWYTNYIEMCLISLKVFMRGKKDRDGEYK